MQPTLPASPIPATQPDRATVRPERWQRELAEAIRDPRELCRMLGLDERLAETVGQPAAPFPLLVPRAFAARMRRGDPRDPLLLQVLPQAVEDEPVAGFVADPLQEADVLAAPGLVRKYAGRALLLVTGGCAVHCRYCFRREFPYASSGATRRGVDAALDAIADDPDVAEVILSGGDPLLADDAHLAEIVERLDALPHVRRLRIHTRLPVVLPARVNDGLLDVLAGSRLARIVVVHANHPAELDDSVADALRRLAALPCTLLNQAVLLAGVNDSADVLRLLSERLVEMGVVPYYLHMLDRVRGAAHFEVPEARARELHGALRDTLPGYAVPRLAREVPGAAAKVWLA
ncbi:MAG: EF-P beta-lysylation protein EpmB [Planctomycetota bacterium]|nr:MAG: EF-P beta-lysylation protein EpmB [Planctomycetota bacterium]